MAYNAEQQKNINLILSIVKQRGLPAQAAQIALMTAMVEAGLQDHSGPSTDHDSGGLFQQRPSAGWGTYQQVRDPVYATNKFLDHLTAIQGWQTMQPGAAAQAVQGSAFPDRYQEHFNEASSIMQSAWPGSKPYAGGSESVMTSAGGGAPATMTPAAQKAALLAGIGPLSSLLTSVPELSALLNTAISSGQTAQEFQNAVNNSKWYRTHSDTVRNNLVQKSSDPAAWNQKFSQLINQIHQLASQNGIAIAGGQDWKLANLALNQGLDGDQKWLTSQIASFQDYTKLKSTAGLTGNMAGAVQQLKQLTAQYGQTWGENQYAYRAQQILEGKQTLDTYKQNVVSAASAMYPGLSQEIQGGQTVQDLAQPYYQTMSNLLEVDQNALTLNDPMIKKALQGAADPKTGMRATTPLWQFEQQVRSDPRWNMTKNAHADTSALLESLGKDWGLSAA